MSNFHTQPTDRRADLNIEIIPKFTALLNRRNPVVLHGDGSPTRRYLFAGDAADAFDTILHRGTLGHVYNVGSYDEISNMELCSKLLKELGIPGESKADFDKWVKYTHDRPFNDHRYAVDGTKLRKLGWDQKTPFAAGLKITVDWYKQFGEKWWGDISNVLTPFPVVKREGDFSTVEKDPNAEVTEEPQSTKKRKVSGVNGTHVAVVA